MLGLFFRKNFYDGWDNVMFLFVPNLILDFLVIITTALCIPGLKFQDSNFYLYIWIALGAICVTGFSILSLAWAESAEKIADYGSFEFKEFFRAIKGCIKDGILFALTLILVGTVCGVLVLNLLFPRGETSVTFVGLLAGAVDLWLALIILMALSWYPSLRAKMHNPFVKSIKKCLIIFMDNLVVSVTVSIYTTVLAVISVIMLGIAPGMAGIELARANALRLLLKKYDYIEELDKQNEPAASPARKRIPWNELLKDENEANPPRGFKEFWMPWKSNQ